MVKNVQVRRAVNVIYDPYAWQSKGHRCPCFEILAEGNRGGGKSDFLLMDYAQGLDKGFGVAYAGLILRRELFELKEIIKKSQKYFKRLYPGAEYSKASRTWTFPGGETLTFSQCANIDDYWKYHGQEFPWIGWDELTTHPTPECYEAMMSCCRSSVPGLTPRIVSTTNPWGAGHAWVKERFIDPAPRGVPITDPATGLTRVAIHADLRENTALLEANPTYIQQLQALSNPLKRKAWLDGDWNIQIGAFFGECWGVKNIVKPITPPEHWLKWRAFDWGSAKPFSVGWFCMSDGLPLPDGRCYPRGAIIRYKEWYGADKTEPNTGLNMRVSEIAAGILERDGDDRIDYSVSDPAIFKEDGAESQAELFRNNGVDFERGDNNRIAGWELMREKMGSNKSDEPPMFYVTENCVDFIRLVPVLLFDERRPEDLDTTAEDHIADECRYGLMTRPIVRDKPRAVKHNSMTVDSILAKMRAANNNRFRL